MGFHTHMVCINSCSHIHTCIMINRSFYKIHSEDEIHPLFKKNKLYCRCLSGILRAKYPEILPALKQLNSLSACVPPKTHKYLPVWFPVKLEKEACIWGNKLYQRSADVKEGWIWPMLRSESQLTLSSGFYRQKSGQQTHIKDLCNKPDVGRWSRAVNTDVCLRDGAQKCDCLGT